MDARLNRTSLKWSVSSLTIQTAAMFIPALFGEHERGDAVDGSVVLWVGVLGFRAVHDRAGVLRRGEGAQPLGGIARDVLDCRVHRARDAAGSEEERGGLSGEESRFTVGHDDLLKVFGLAGCCGTVRVVGPPAVPVAGSVLSFEAPDGGDSMSDDPIFMAVAANDPLWRKTVLDAQASLPEFRSLLESEHASKWYPSIKTRITSGEDTALMWLSVVKVLSSGFLAELYEIPPEFEGVRVGDQRVVRDEEVLDWMMNQNGTLRGGFSVRYQRSKLPPEEWAEFDAYVGISDYGDPRKQIGE